MDKSTWFYLLLAGLSIVYNYYKKAKKKQENENYSEPNAHSEEAESSWDLDTLISEFQKEYGVEKEFENPIEVEESNPEPILPVKTELNNSEQLVNSHSNVEYVDPVDHSDLVDRINEAKEINLDLEVKDVELKHDLREMIIQSTILNRPEY